MVKLAALSLGAIGLSLLLTTASPAQPLPTLPAPPAPPPGTPAPNTTGPLKRPIIATIGPETYFINEFGADSIYVIVGTQRALVVDTGSGFMDLKATVEGLTKLPYDVVITHSHPDHAGGAGLFDSVYIHPADIAAASAITYEGRVRYGQIMRSMSARPGAAGFPDVWGYTDADVRRWPKIPEFKPLSDGQVFDLGGRKVTAYHLPNHTPGSMVFIDDKSRIAFTGDAANAGGNGSNGPVSTTLRGLLRLRELRATSFDRQYTGHTAYANRIDAIPQSNQALDDLIEAYRSILRGNAQLQTIPNNLNPSQSQTVAVHGLARVTFRPNLLWEPGEAQVVP